jgi:hypothetical protein
MKLRFLQPPLGVGQRAHLRRVISEEMKAAEYAERAGTPKEAARRFDRALRAERELRQLDRQ